MTFVDKPNLYVKVKVKSSHCMYSIKTIVENGENLRALRYYEQLGILLPDMRTDAGYRMYSDKPFSD